MGWETSGFSCYPKSQHLSLLHTRPHNKPTKVRDLSLSLPPGGKLLIVGNSGTGKSSLLRVMAGLWGAGSGSIVRPSTAEMFFLPQASAVCIWGRWMDR